MYVIQKSSDKETIILERWLTQSTKGFGMFQEDGVSETAMEKWNHAHPLPDQLTNAYSFQEKKAGLSRTKLTI